MPKAEGWPEGADVPVQDDLRPATVPRDLMEEAYKEYAAQYGTSQSCDRLIERGGFGIVELAILLYQRIKRLDAHGRKSE